MTTEQLGADLYGDIAANSSVRGEVSRLRKLGVPISSEPYRLTVPVESDASRLQAMLRRGAVREAAESYTGPLLPCRTRRASCATATSSTAGCGTRS